MEDERVQNKADDFNSGKSNISTDRRRRVHLTEIAVYFRDLPRDLEHGHRNKLHSIAAKFHLEPDLSQFSHLSREFRAISATIDAKRKKNTSLLFLLTSRSSLLLKIYSSDNYWRIIPRRYSGLILARSSVR